MDFISGQLISLTNRIHRIPGQFVNKPGKGLFCDRALLKDITDRGSYLSHECIYHDDDREMSADERVTAAACTCQVHIPINHSVSQGT